MIYPEAFKERVKKAYPNNPAILNALEKGDKSLLNLLMAENDMAFSIEEIDSYSFEELQEKRKNIEERNAIFTDFMEIYANDIMQKAKKG